MSDLTLGLILGVIIGIIPLCTTYTIISIVSGNKYYYQMLKKLKEEELYKENIKLKKDLEASDYSLKNEEIK